MFLQVRRCVEHMTQLPRLKVKFTGQGQRIYPWISCLLYISWTLEAIFIKLHLNISLSEIMCITYDPATQTQGQVHVIYPSMCVHSISPKPFELVSLNFIQMFLLVRQSKEHMTQPNWLKVKVSSQGIYAWIWCLFRFSWTPRSIIHETTPKCSS